MRFFAWLPVLVVALAAAFAAGYRSRPEPAPIERESARGRELRRMAGLLRGLFADANRNQEDVYGRAVAALRARHAAWGLSGEALDRATLADPALLPVARYGSKVMQIKVGGGEVARELDLLAERLFAAPSPADEDAIWREGTAKLAALGPKIIEYTHVLDELTASVGEPRLPASKRLLEGLAQFSADLVPASSPVRKD